jgi:hypothetical protein
MKVTPTYVAKFMQTLGLKSLVELDLLLEKISRGTSAERYQLLQYLMDQFDVDYLNSYIPERINTPFLPIQNADRLSLPLECFTNPEVATMDFFVLDPLLRKYAIKLGVPVSPSGDQVIQKLKDVPIPLAKAAEVFGFLSSQQASLNSRHWGILRHLEFIPVIIESVVHYFPPSRVYLKTQQSIFQGSFVYVSFGTTADTFLRACGVQEQPSPVELASSMVRDPTVYLQNGFSEYLDLLRQIAANFRTIKSNKTLVSQMKQSGFLVGITSHEENGQTVQKYSLGKASDIYLIDDTVISQLFQPLGAPVEDLLESMYSDLGSQWISSLVHISYTPSGTPSSTDQTAELQQSIQNRAPLILYDGLQTRPNSELLPNALYILQNLKIQSVSKIGIVRRFNGISKSQETTSCILSPKTEKILLVSPKFDYFDVSNMVARLILKQPRLNDSLLISTLLSTSLESLTQKGFPIARILSIQPKNKAEDLPIPKVHAPFNGNDNGTSVKSQNTLTVNNTDNRSATINTLNNFKEEKRTKSSSPTVSGSNDFFGVMKAISDSLGLSDENKVSKKNHNSQVPGSWKDSSLNSMEKSPQNILSKRSGNKPVITPRDKDILAAQLQKSISNVRGANDQNIRANFPQDEPPFPSYCSALTDQDLVLVTTINSTPVYAEKSVADEGAVLILSNEDAIERFSLVLQFLSMVFGLPAHSTHIYLDSDGSTVAFNRNRGTLFFNFRYYLGWHYKNSNEPENAITYHSWFMTFCHELAHNFHGPHDATHEYWMASFAENYLGKLIEAMHQYGIK